MADETSGGGGETPNPSTTATVTPGQSGATPATTPPLSAEELTKRLADLERSLSNAKEENTRHSKRLTAYEKLEKEQAEAKRLADEAQLSEIERVKKQAADAQQQIQQYKQQLVMAQVKLAAKDKGIIDPDLAALALQSTLEYGDDGMPTNLEKALENLIKNKPYLVPAPPAEPATTPAQTATPNQSAPTLPPFAGRSSIPGPGATPGRIPQWNEVFKRP